MNQPLPYTELWQCNHYIWYATAYFKRPYLGNITITSDVEEILLIQEAEL